MNLTSGFCPKCGNPSENGELCGPCRVKDTVWITISPRVECTICPTCESIKSAGVWSDAKYDREELSLALVNDGIKIHPDVMDVQQDIFVRETSINRSMATVLVTGNLYGVPVETTQKVKIVWAREQCDRCCRISGSYYEGVIQVRANGRKPTAFELQKAARIAYQIEDMLQTNGDRLSFVSDIEETKDGGIDIVFSSQTIGNAISTDICGALGGSYTTHPKLVGEKAGIKLYRVTYSVRLPRFARGDVIIHEKGYYRIVRQMKDTLFVQDLKTGQRRTFREDDSDPLLGNIREAETGSVIYKDAGILGVLDPKTQEVAEVLDHLWLEAEPGEMLLFVRDKEVIVPVGKLEEDESSDYIEEESGENAS